MRHVITLSTIPPRFSGLGPTLRALVAQSSRPEAVELWIPQHYRRFPGYGGELPEVPEGVAIRRCDTDLGPATKVLPAAQERRGQAVDLIFCDDDQLYRRDWAARLLAVRARRPADAVTAGGTNAEASALGASAVLVVLAVPLQASVRETATTTAAARSAK